MGSPRLLMLDEPVSALDPESRRAVKNLIKKLSRSRNVTVIITSHSLADVEELCSRVAILDQGRLVANDTMPNPRETQSVSFLRIRLVSGQSRASIDSALASIDAIADYSWIADDAIQVAITPGVRPSAILHRLALGSVEFREVSEVGNSLEDVFLTAIAGEKGLNSR